MRNDFLKCTQCNSGCCLLQAGRAMVHTHAKHSAHCAASGAGGAWRLAQKHYFNQRGARLSAVDYHGPTGMLVAAFSNGIFDLYEVTTAPGWCWRPCSWAASGSGSNVVFDWHLARRARPGDAPCMCTVCLMCCVKMYGMQVIEFRQTTPRSLH